MAQQDGIQVGDVGTLFVVTIVDKDDAAVDISQATTKNFIFLKPRNLGSFTVAASFAGTGSDGKLTYVTIANDIDVEGTWHIQAEVSIPSLGDFKSEIQNFKVRGNLT